jgi:hypothetical protein
MSSFLQNLKYMQNKNLLTSCHASVINPLYKYLANEFGKIFLWFNSFSNSNFSYRFLSVSSDNDVVLCIREIRNSRLSRLIDKKNYCCSKILSCETFAVPHYQPLLQSPSTTLDSPLCAP